MLTPEDYITILKKSRTPSQCQLRNPEVNSTTFIMYFLLINPFFCQHELSSSDTCMFLWTRGLRFKPLPSAFITIPLQKKKKKNPFWHRVKINKSFPQLMLLKSCTSFNLINHLFSPSHNLKNQVQPSYSRFPFPTLFVCLPLSSLDPCYSISF